MACGVAFFFVWCRAGAAATTGAARGAGGARAQAGQMTPGASAGRFRLVWAPGEQMRAICRARGRATPQEGRERACLARSTRRGAFRSLADKDPRGPVYSRAVLREAFFARGCKEGWERCCGRLDFVTTYLSV